MYVNEFGDPVYDPDTPNLNGVFSSSHNGLETSILYGGGEWTHMTAESTRDAVNQQISEILSPRGQCSHTPGCLKAGRPGCRVISYRNESIFTHLKHM